MKFLTDTQTPMPFVECLRLLGWDVVTVYQYDLQYEKDDAVILRKATELDRILITFDYLRGEQGVRIARELRDQGGQLIRISGGPDQPVLRALGKLLFHHERWLPWFAANEGRVVISDTRQVPSFTLRSDLSVNVQVLREPPFESYLEQKESARTKPRKARVRRRKVATQESLLGNGGQDRRE